MRIQTLLSGLVSASALAAIIYGWVAPRSLHAASPPAQAPAPSSATLARSAEESRETARKLTRAAAQQWARLDVQPVAVDRLCHDVETLLYAYLQADFPSYAELMASKKCRLGPRAEALLDAFNEWKVQPETPADDPIDTRMRAVWRSPEPRAFTWTSVNAESVQCGLGLIKTMPSPDWPHDAYVSQATVFEPPGGFLTSEAVAAIDHTAKTAWCMMLVTLSDNVTTHVDLRFYYHDELACWLPFAVVVGAEGERRVWPLI